MLTDLVAVIQRQQRKRELREEIWRMERMSLELQQRIRERREELSGKEAA